MTREQWKAIEEKDAAYDGRFFYGTKSAKTICRPSCPARRKNPKDLIIFESLEEGLGEGYHVCKRCRPDLPSWNGAKANLTERAKAYMEAHYTEKFSLDVMAKALFIDKVYLSKTFREISGETPLCYFHRLRCEKAAALLEDTDLSIEIIGVKAGFATPSHFSRIFKEVFGLTPSEYREKYYASLTV